ncbi:uncharacterized protein LOC109457324 isoform X3 [Rhinolophus sinicus]|uniref:uncharacterized protein LOC109457324 isoform X3 n=1 Tax=Rhinolophus sinicus TaxID=89399 RepID=UPI003D79B047
MLGTDFWLKESMIPSCLSDLLLLSPPGVQEDTQMDPLIPTLTGQSLWNEADTPRTHDLKHLRAKRVAYYESIGIIKGDDSRNDGQPVLTTSQDTNMNASENQTFRLRGPQTSLHYLAIGKKPALQESSKVAPMEAEQCQDHRHQEGPRRESFPAELDLRLLDDDLVPETQKLRHVINWAQKFLTKPLEEHGLKSPTASLGLPQANLCQGSKALGSKRNTPLSSSDSPPLLREDQSRTRTDIHRYSLSPQNNWSETDLSSEFLSSFQKESFQGSQSCGWQGTTVREDGEGRASGCPPARLPQEDYVQQMYQRAGDSGIQTPNKDEMFPKRLGALPQLRHTSEERNVLEEASQSPPRNSYFWTPLTDSSEEERSDEPGESKGTLRRGVLSRECRGYSGIALSPTSDSSILLSKTTVRSGISSPGDTPLEGEVREDCTGAVDSPVESPKDVTGEFKADSSKGEGPIQRLPGGQQTTPYGSSSQRRKESENVGFSLWSLQTDIKHKNEWKHAVKESVGKTIMGRVPRGGPKRSVQSSAKSSPLVITQRQFDLTHPESSVTPEMTSLSLNVSEGPLEKAVFHLHSGTSVFCGPTADAHGTRSSTWFDQLLPPEMDGRSAQTPRVLTMQTTHKQKEKTLSSSHLISRDSSKTGLTRSFPLQDAGANLSWRDESPHKPEQGASVLETYFYYLQMLNKIGGLSSEERNSSLPFQGPRLSESESAITSPEGKGRSKGASLWETKERANGCESVVAVEAGRGPCPRGEGCVEETAPDGASVWKPQGKLCSATPEMTSKTTGCGGYQEMSSTACTSHKHGDVKLRSQSISRPNSAEAEGTSTGTYPCACAVGSVEKFFCKNMPQDVERENEEHKRDADISQWLLLPDEIWICVFSLLSHKELARVAQVCCHFYRLASDESLWKRVQISDCCILEDNWLVALARHHPRSLTLHRCRHAGQAVTGHGLKRLFQHCGNILQELNVISCSGPGLTGDKVLLHAAALCSKLTAVDVSWSGATDVGMMALIQGASSLHGLSINGCQITDKAIKALVKKHGNSLHKIEVFGCLALTSRSIGTLALQCPHLQTLNIGRVPKVSEACLVRSLENLREVTALNVAGLKMVRDQIIHLIVTQCPKLDNLVLSSCAQVTDVSLVEISTNLRTLRVCSLANYCHMSLECVKLSFCKNVTLDAVKKLCKSCKRLKILHLYGYTITSDLCKIKEVYQRVKIFHDISALAC